MCRSQMRVVGTAAGQHPRSTGCDTWTIRRLGCRTANSKCFGTGPATPDRVGSSVSVCSHRQLEFNPHSSDAWLKTQSGWRWRRNVSRAICHVGARREQAGPKVSQAVASAYLEPRRLPMSPGGKRSEVRAASPLPLEAAFGVHCRQQGG